MAEQLSYQDFASKIKSKYPQYKDIDDLELAQKIVAKYPEYEGQVLFDVKKKESGVSESLEEPTTSGIVSTPEQEFLATGEVATTAAPQKTRQEKFAEQEKALFTSDVKDEEEKDIVSEAVDATNRFYAERGGMTPFQKMNELQSRVDAIQSKYKATDIANLSQEELDKIEQEYTDEVSKAADELGLQINEDGSVKPYDEEIQSYKERLNSNTALAQKSKEKRAGFGENMLYKLSSGYERAASNVIDLLGVATGLNYFDSFKGLSEGAKYNSEQLSKYANRYDDTIQNYLMNGEIGKAAGAAFSGAVESLPTMLPVFINPTTGLGVMSGMSGIDKFREIEDANIPEWSKYYNAFITGASEYAGEKLVTLPILARSKQAILKLGEKKGKQAIETALKKSVENNAAKLGRMPEWMAEGLSEVATGISTDLVDKVTVNPELQIGSHAVDDFAVGAVMGKVFALPQDLAKGMDKLVARDFAKNVVAKLPDDMDIETKISLGWKIAERDRLVEAENKLDEKFKGKYQERIVKINTEIDDIAQKYSEQTMTVGTTEADSGQQEQLDYLNEQGVEIHDGTTTEQLQKLYEKTKQKESTSGIKTEETTEIVPERVEPVSQKEETIVTEPTAEEKLADLEKGNTVTFTYKNESEIPEQLKDRVSSVSEVNGKKEYRVTISKVEADYILDKSRVTNLKEQNGINEATEKVQERTELLGEKPEDQVTETSKETAEASAEGAEAEIDVAKLSKGDKFQYKGKSFEVGEKTEDGRIISSADWDYVATLDKQGQKDYLETAKELRDEPFHYKKVEEAKKKKKENYRYSDSLGGRSSDPNRMAAYVEYIAKEIGRGSEFDEGTLGDFAKLTESLRKLGNYNSSVAKADAIKAQKPPKTAVEPLSPPKGENIQPEGKVGEKSFKTHTGEVVSGERLTTALNKAADKWAELQRAIRKEDKYAPHVTEQEKDDNLAEGLATAEQIRRGEKNNEFWAWQRINEELTGESVPYLPNGKSPALTPEKEGTTQAKESQKRQQTEPIAKDVIEKESTTEITKEEPKVVKATGIKPTNLRDVYRAGREIFGLNKAQALAQAIVVDRVVEKIAKRRGVTKDKVYSEIEFRKSTMEDLSGRGKKLYQIIGKNANLSKTVKDNLGVALDMESAKKDSKTIRFATGWEIGADGKWRYEIPDGKLSDYVTQTIRRDSPKTIKNVPLEGILDSEELFNAYPELRGINIKSLYLRSGNPQGQSSGDGISANAPDYNSLLSVLLHEVQHIIQAKEGFAKGGNNYFSVPVILQGTILKDGEKYFSKDKFDRIVGNIKLIEGYADKIKNNPQAVTEDDLRKMSLIRTSVDTDLRDYATLKYNIPTGKDVFFEVYKKISGETEARNVQKRIGYTPEQRRTSLLEETEDVSRDEQIILFQKQGKGKTAKGAIQFLSDGRAIISALTDPNVSTPLHEIAHLYEKYMTKEERQAVLNWTGDKTWTTSTSEKFAIGFEKYLATGKAPKPSLQKVFDRFKTWLTEIYNGITGSEIDLELNDAMTAVYASMLGEEAAKTKSRTTKETKVEYKKTFKDVDDLLFQKGVLFQGEDKIEKHTQAVNKLVDNFEKEGEQDIAKAVRDYLGERGNPVSEEIINNVLKERGYAKTQQGRPLQDSGDETGEGRGQRDSDLSKVNRPVVQDGEKAEEKVRQFGQKISESTVLSPDLKKSIVERGIGYIPRGRKISKTEARELIRIYDELGGMDRVKAEIMSPDFRVNGDTRIAMATMYVNDRIAKSKSETDPQKAEQYRDDAADIMEFYVNRSTGVAQELEGMKLWNEVIGSHPDFIAETVRKTAEKQNAEFYDTYANDISAAKKIIDDFVNSKEFKDKYGQKKETPAARKQRGINKIASGIDKLATLRGIRFQAVPETDMPTNEYEALKEIASGILDVGIASVEELIAELKTQTRRYFSPAEIDKVAKNIAKDIDAKNNLKKKTAKIVLDKTDEEQIIDKLYKSMVFATRKQLKQLVADNIELLQEKGLISDRAFRELIAKAVGRIYVSDKQIAAVEKAAKVINDAKNIEKNIDNLFDDYITATEEKNKPEIERLKKEVDRQLKEYKKAMLEAGIASSEIGNVFADSPTLVKMFATFIQGNLLTPASLKVNLLANLLVSPIRLARNAMAVGLDILLSEIGTLSKGWVERRRDPYWREVAAKMLAEERTFTSTALNAGLIRGFASGTKEGVAQMWKGQAQDDITNRDVSKAMKPLMAWYDLYQAATGKEKLRMNEIVQKFVEGTFGIPPEIMFRFLNLGDKPFRRAAEQARLDELAGINKNGIIKDFLTRLATDNGLDAAAIKEFVKNPDKDSKKDANDYFEAWKSKFMIRPDEESWELARKAGLEAVYQQDNVLSNALKGIQKATAVKTGIDTLDKIISSVARFLFVINIPFVKTPTNVMIETLEYAVPIIPFARAMLFDAPKGDRRAFVKNMSKAIIGTSINTAVGSLFGFGVMGLAQGGGDDEQKERVPTEVKAAEYYYRPPYYMNTRAMADLWSNIIYGTNKDLSWKEGDTMQQYTRYGLPSAILMAHAQGYAGMKPEEIKRLGLWDRQLLFTMPALKAGLDQSYVKNVSALINALKGDEYEQESYLVGLTKATEASVLPNSYRAYQQAKDNYIRETRMATLQGKERIVKSIANDFATSYNIGKMPPPRVSIWGEDVERYQDGKSPLLRVFDISKERTYGNGFGIELFNLYTKTQNNDVLPPDVPNRIKVLDDYVKVDGELYHDLVQYSAGKHKMVVSAIINSDAWKQLPNDAAKVEFISDVYKGKVNGVDIPTRSDFTREFVSAHKDQFIELYKKQHGIERYEKLKRGTE